MCGHKTWISDVSDVLTSNITLLFNKPAKFIPESLRFLKLSGIKGSVLWLYLRQFLNKFLLKFVIDQKNKIIHSERA